VPPGTWLLSVDEHGRLMPNRVVEAFPTGTKPTVRLTTAGGRQVVCTLDHKFYTPQGFRPLREIGVGGTLLVGTDAPGRAPTYRGRGGRRAAAWPSALPPVAGGALEIAAPAAYRPPTRLVADTIAAIEPLGEQPTYNLTMAAPYHNYLLANGLVSANSHAVCYAYVAYQTAYLKANYPVEYMAAVLSCQGDDTDKVVAAIGECRRLGIEVLPPDVQRSQKHFTVEQVEGRDAAGEPRRAIRFGLGAIKNVGEGAVDAILAERARGGPFRSLDDFCRRVDLRALNKRVIESLIKAGALDAFGPRERLLAALDSCLASAQAAQRAEARGQASLFALLGENADSPEAAGTTTPLPPVPTVSPRERLAWEKESLGVYLSDHPFQDAARWLRGRVTATTASLSEETGNEKVTLAGVLSGVRRILTKKRETMVVAQLEDLHGSIEVIVFPRTLERTAELWRDDAIVIVEGRLDSGRDERPGRQLICEAAEEWTPPPPGSEPPPVEPDPPATAVSAPPAWARATEASAAAAGAAPTGTELSPAPARHLRLRFVREGDDDTDYSRLRSLHALLSRQPGPDTYELLLVHGDAEYRLLVPEARVACTPTVERALRQLLGPANVQVV